MPHMEMIPFSTQDAEPQSGIVSLEKLQNLYLEANPAHAKGPVTVYGTPGLSRWATIGTGPIRGMRAMGASLYVVSGNTLFAVASNGHPSEVGHIASTGNVFMTDNGTHIGIATRTAAYAANASEVIQLPETGMNGATYQDGFGIFTQAHTEKFWVTAVDDMTTLPPLDFSTTDAFADNLVGCISDHRELWLFGESTAEVWYNAANPTGSPFSRSQGGFIERGCKASGSISKARNQVFWLGDDGAFYTAAGYQAQSISSPAIEKIVSEVADPGSAWAFMYHEQGHTFYVVSFSDKTICYDLETGLWHQRKSEGIGRWRANCYSEFYGKRLVGDYADGRIYKMDLGTYNDDGETISRIAILPPLFSNGDRIALHELQLDCQTGVGLSSGQGSDPLFVLDWSDDGGKSWSNIRFARAGELGAYGTKVRWNRLGTFVERSLRITITDPVKVAIVGAYARLGAPV